MIRFLLWLLAAYCAIVLVLVVFQSRLIFLPDAGGRDLVATPGDVRLSYRDLSIKTSDGEALHAWWIPHPKPRATLLFSHGNAGNISYRLDSLRRFHDLGLSVLIYDYRGYGQSTGRPDEAGIYLDGEAALRWLADEGRVRSENIVLFGRSMGGAVASRLAVNNEVAGLIVESSFTSVPDLAQELYWWIPARWLVHIRLPTQQFLSESNQPTLVVHSQNDEIVPFRHGWTLYQTAPQPKRFLQLRGSHNGGFLDSGDVYVAGLDSFLAEVMGR